ncbi:MAG: hypothetical protein R2812_06620 [Gelidibacter sp.]
MQKNTSFLCESVNSVTEELQNHPGKRIHTPPQVFSLKSIKAKKEHQIRQMEVVIDPNDLPKEDFTEAQFLKEWKTYIKSLQTT